jgi:hypothetical protein
MVKPSSKPRDRGHKQQMKHFPSSVMIVHVVDYDDFDEDAPDGVGVALQEEWSSENDDDEASSATWALPPSTSSRRRRRSYSFTTDAPPRNLLLRSMLYIISQINLFYVQNRCICFLRLFLFLLPQHKGQTDPFLPQLFSCFGY